MSGPFLSFVHIEKAGGITLHNLFHRRYFGYVSPHPAKWYGNPWIPGHLAALQQLSPFRVTGVGGHRIRAYFDYGSAVKCPVFYFTMMRDPIARYLSHLNWQKFLQHKGWTIESFTADPYMNNFQAYRIAGERDAGKAKKVMEKNFHLIGMMEKYDEAMVLLKMALGTPQADFRYRESNVKNYQDEIFRFETLSGEMQEKVMANNAIDLELYRFLKEELYPQYRSSYPGNLEKDLGDYQAANKNFQYPVWALMKRKISNVLMAKIIQPRMFRLMVKKGEILPDGSYPDTI